MAHQQPSLPKRPPPGDAGTPINVFVNAMQIDFHKDALAVQSLLELTVEFEPPIKSRQRRFEIWNIFERSKQLLNFPAFDGTKTVFSTQPLIKDQYEVMVETVQGKWLVYLLKFQTLQSVSFTSLGQMTYGMPKISPMDSMANNAIRAFNIIIRHAAFLNAPSNGRVFFRYGNGNGNGNGGNGNGGYGGGGGGGGGGQQTLQPPFELFRGFFQAVRPGTQRLLLNIDVTCGTFYTSTSLLTICSSYLSRILRNLHSPPQPNILRLGDISDRERVQISRFIKGLKIKYHPPGKNFSHFALIGLDNSIPGTKRFVFKGNNITVLEYFRRVYNINLRYTDIPLVQVKKDVFLPMEFCQVKEKQLYKKKLTKLDQAAALKFATMKPKERFNHVFQGPAVRQYLESPQIKEVGLRIHQEPMRAVARVLDPPPLHYGGRTELPRNGQWNIKQVKFNQPATVQSWLAINFAKGQINPSIVTDLMNNARQRDMNFSQPRFAPGVYRGQRESDSEFAIKIKRHLKEQVKREDQIVLVILDFKDDTLYSVIKTWGDEVGIPTQILFYDMKKWNDQYRNNLLLKINPKLGGVNHSLRRADLGAPPEQIHMMIVGMDITHSGSGEHALPSIAAMCASTNPDFTHYISVIRAQELLEPPPDTPGLPKKQEVIVETQSMFAELHAEYRKKNGAVPEYIVVYRDGVSEGELAAVAQREVAAILDTIRTQSTAWGTNPAKLIFMVAGKRHHIRFVLDGENGQNWNNTPAGTVVDTEVIHPAFFDWYSQPHHAIQGTACPVHYIVLHDDAPLNSKSNPSLKSNQLQKLTNGLSHGFQRASRSVSLVTPAYYADLLCTRARLWMWDLDADSDGQSGSSNSTTRANDFRAYEGKIQSITRGLTVLHGMHSQWWL